MRDCSRLDLREEIWDNIKQAHDFGAIMGKVNQRIDG